MAPARGAQEFYLICDLTFDVSGVSVGIGGQKTSLCGPQAHPGIPQAVLGNATKRH